jgi:predicted helicase
VNPLVVDKFSRLLGAEVTEEQIFYYCFGIFSLPAFQSKFQDDIKKVKPRVPVSKDFFAICDLGRKLASIQLDYENLDPYPLSFEGGDAIHKVRKLRIVKTKDEWTLDIDNKVRISGIPKVAWSHTIFGRSPLEWVVDRYQMAEDKESGLVNDPNSYSDEQDFVVKMVGRAVTMSLEMSALLDAATVFEFLNISEES